MAGFEKQFIEEVRQQVAQLCVDYPQQLSSTNDAFTVWAVQFLHELSIDEALDAASAPFNRPGDRGIDARFIDGDAETVYLYQMKYLDDVATKASDSSILELLRGTARLLTESDNRKSVKADGAESEGEDVYAQTRDILAGGADLVIRVVVWGALSDAARQGARAIQEIISVPMQLEIYDFEAIAKLAYARATHASAPSEIRLSLMQDVIPERYEIAAPGGGSLSLRVLAVDAYSVAEAARDHGVSLIRDNVRGLIDKSKVNKSIAGTVTAVSAAENGVEVADLETRGLFLVLNNGLTVLCSQVDFADGQAVLYRPSLVNGGQTAMTLRNNITSFTPGQSYVLCRVIEVESAGEQVAELISEATNRQNAVTVADLKANEDLQKDLQARFQGIGWYYERQRGLASTTPDIKLRFGANIIGMEDVGQRRRMWIGEPALAIARKSEIYEDAALYGRVFNSQVSPWEFLAAYSSFEFFHKNLTKGRFSRLQSIYPSLDEPLRANIMTARAQWSAHCTALLAHLVGADATPDALRKVAEGATDGWNSPETNAIRQSAGIVLATGSTWVKKHLAQNASAADTGQQVALKSALQRPSAFNDWKVEAEGLQGLLAGFTRSTPSSDLAGS